VELHQLRYLVAVCEEGSYTRAAAREHVAQPAVSAALGALERELGVTLLERGRHGARPTEAGRAVLAHARAALAAVAGARHVADELTGLLRGRVQVGMVVGCTSEVLADLLADFTGAHPAVEVALEEGGSDELLARLAGGELDLAWVGRAGPPPAGIETAVVYEEEQVAVVPAAEGQAGRLPVAELAGRRLVALPRGTGGRTALDEACARAGVVPAVACEATGLEMVLRLAARGLGTGLVPASVAAAHGGAVAARPLDPPVRSRIELAWRAGGPASPAGRALVAVAREHVARKHVARSAGVSAAGPPA
jgi:DNA-binding transcriptional LysR family regulator